MQFAMAEKFHEKYLEDVMKEISQDDLWRQRLFEGKYNEEFLLTYKKLEELPCNLWANFSKYGLEFSVSKVDSCPEKVSEGLIMFKFQAMQFKHIVSYSSNRQKNF